MCKLIWRQGCVTDRYHAIQKKDVRTVIISIWYTLNLACFRSAPSLLVLQAQGLYSVYVVVICYIPNDCTSYNTIVMWHWLHLLYAFIVCNIFRECACSTLPLPYPYNFSTDAVCYGFSLVRIMLIFIEKFFSLLKSIRNFCMSKSCWKKRRQNSSVARITCLSNVGMIN